MPDREQNEVPASKSTDEVLEPGPKSGSIDTLLRNIARTPARSVPPVSLASGRYVVHRVLGEGGQKIVYLVHDSALNRDCALSVIKTELIDPNDLLRLRREAQAIAHLGPHPHIVSIYDLGEEDGRPYVVSEFLPGGDLRQLLRAAGGPLSVDKALTLAEDVCQALAFAHAHAIVHRDIKPENIWLSADGTAKLGDFGLALAVDRSRLTLSGAILGTSAYVAPEQAQAQPVDARTDLYSLGCVLYELTTGQPPFVGNDPLLVISQHVLAQPTPASQRNSAVTPEVDQLLRRMLAKIPHDRPASADEVLSELKHLRTMEPASRDGLGAALVRSPTGPPISERVATDLTRRSRSLWIVALVLVAGLGALIAFGRGGWQHLLRRATPPHIQSIVVLPLDNLSGDPSQQYFADGMTDAVITNLAQISDLRVISRMSAMQYKGSGKKTREIAGELNVDALVEGSVFRSGSRIRISGRLLDAATDQQLWANSYERDLTDVVALQGEVARAIAKGIRARIRPQEQERLANAHAIQPEAYENYLKGQFHRLRENKLDNEAAIVLLERAVSLDPSFADAYAELGHAYAIRFFLFDPQRQWEERAFVAIEKAAALKPNLAEAHFLRGYLLWTSSNHFPHERAAQEYRRALAINPNLDEAHHYLGLIYFHIGLFDKALDEIQKALAINPSNTIARYRLGPILHHQGHYEKALAALQSMPMEFSPSTLGRQMPWTLFALGRRDEAAALVEQNLRDNPRDEGGQLTSMQAVILAAAGQPEKAKEKIEEAAKLGKGFSHFHHAAYHIAVSYALLEETELAVRWLRQAAVDGYPCYPLFENDPGLNNIRRDARFIQFMAELKRQWEYYKATL